MKFDENLPCKINIHYLTYSFNPLYLQSLGLKFTFCNIRKSYQIRDSSALPHGTRQVSLNDLWLMKCSVNCFTQRIPFIIFIPVTSMNLQK